MQAVSIFRPLYFASSHRKQALGSLVQICAHTLYAADQGADTMSKTVIFNSI